jgi:hypothetical protein
MPHGTFVTSNPAAGSVTAGHSGKPRDRQGDIRNYKLERVPEPDNMGADTSPQRTLLVSK